MLGIRHSSCQVSGAKVFRLAQLVGLDCGARCLALSTHRRPTAQRLRTASCATAADEQSAGIATWLSRQVPGKTNWNIYQQYSLGRHGNAMATTVNNQRISNSGTEEPRLSSIVELDMFQDVSKIGAASTLSPKLDYQMPVFKAPPVLVITCIVHSVCVYENRLYRFQTLCHCRGLLGNIAVNGQQRRCNVPVKTHLPFPESV